MTLVNCTILIHFFLYFRTLFFSLQDILSSPAAIQIRQLEALQTMARTASSKVVFVPMNLFGGAEGGANAFPQAAMLENMTK